jgi:hypothetical protein
MLLPPHFVHECVKVDLGVSSSEVDWNMIPRCKALSVFDQSVIRTIPCKTPTEVITYILHKHYWGEYLIQTSKTLGKIKYTEFDQCLTDQKMVGEYLKDFYITFDELKKHKRYTNEEAQEALQELFNDSVYVTI